jgi:hypothetical protein
MRLTILLFKRQPLSIWRPISLTEKLAVKTQGKGRQVTPQKREVLKLSIYKSTWLPVKGYVLKLLLMAVDCAIEVVRKRKRISTSAQTSLMSHSHKPVSTRVLGEGTDAALVFVFTTDWKIKHDKIYIAQVRDCTYNMTTVESFYGLKH